MTPSGANAQLRQVQLQNGPTSQASDHVGKARPGGCEVCGGRQVKHYPDQDVASNRRSVRRRARQLEQRQRRALREQGQRLLERAGRLLGPRNDEGPLPRID